MIRIIQLVLRSDPFSVVLLRRAKSLLLRVEIVILILPVIFLTSCMYRSAEAHSFAETHGGASLPNNLTIKDLAPENPDGSPEVNKLKTINLDLHVLEIPVENFIKLDDIRRALSIRPLKFNNYLAFSDNSFSAYYGKNQRLSTVYDLLQIAGAQNITRVAIMLPDGDSDDIIIKQLPGMQTVSFSSMSGSSEAARIGPGVLAMHISVEKSGSINDAGTVTILPIFTRMTTNTIPEFALMEKMHDFLFTSATLKLDMTPGDFIFLAPERLITDQSTLCGLFFGNPYGSVFMNPQDNKLPERRETVRVYVLTCVGLNF